MKLPLFSTQGEKSDTEIELLDSIFGIEPNETVLYEDVRRFMTNKRQGNASTKSRSEVRGGGRKAYRQKGTGRARRGSIRSPLLKGGGTAFGPKPKTYKIRMNKKMRRLARKSALASKAADDSIVIIEDFSFEEPKTKRIIEILSYLDIHDEKVLLLTAETDENIYKSARNIPNVKVLEANKPNSYQILDASMVLIQQGALEVLEQMLEPDFEEES